MFQQALRMMYLYTTNSGRIIKSCTKEGKLEKKKRRRALDLAVPRIFNAYEMEYTRFIEFGVLKEDDENA